MREIKFALKKSDEIGKPARSQASPSYASSTQKWWWWANSLLVCPTVIKDQPTEEASRGGEFSTSKGQSTCCDPLCRHIYAPPTTTYPRWTFNAKFPDKTWHDPSKNKRAKFYAPKFTQHRQPFLQGQQFEVDWAITLASNLPDYQNSKLSNSVPNPEATLATIYPQSWDFGELLGTTTPLWASHTELTPNPRKVCASPISINNTYQPKPNLTPDVVMDYLLTACRGWHWSVCEWQDWYSWLAWNAWLIHWWPPPLVNLSCHRLFPHSISLLISQTHVREKYGNRWTYI